MTTDPARSAPDRWFLTAVERDNDATAVDLRAAGRRAWTAGNRVRPLVHGAAYFAELLAAVGHMRSGDQLFFTDWRGDADERLAGPGTEVAAVLADAAARGVAAPVPAAVALAGDPVVVRPGVPAPVRPRRRRWWAVTRGRR